MERYESISGKENNSFIANEYDDFIPKAGQHDPEDIIIEVEQGSIPEELVGEMANNTMGLEESRKLL